MSGERSWRRGCQGRSGWGRATSEAEGEVLSRKGGLGRGLSWEGLEQDVRRMGLVGGEGVVRKAFLGIGMSEYDGNFHGILMIVDGTGSEVETVLYN